MNIAQKNALIKIISIVNARYDGYKTENARYCLRNLIRRKSNSNKYSEAAKDIENLALIEVKKEGYELLHDMIDNIRYMNEQAEDSQILLHELLIYDRSKTIEKSLKHFKFDRKATCSIPRQIKFLFGSGTLNCEDVENCEERIKNFCSITDDFFIKAVRENPHFKNYRTNSIDEFNNFNGPFNNFNDQNIPQKTAHHILFSSPNVNGHPNNMQYSRYSQYPHPTYQYYPQTKK